MIPVQHEYDAHPVALAKRMIFNFIVCLFLQLAIVMAID